MSGYQPIETYPREWGPPVLVLAPTEYGLAPYVAHLEANEWLVRDPDDPVSWCRLKNAPTYWMPLPEPPT